MALPVYHDQGPLAINITTEYDGPGAFISGFKIQSPDKIETPGYNKHFQPGSSFL